MILETFPALEVPGLIHSFSTRSQVPLTELEQELIATYTTAGFDLIRSVQAEQPHGNKIAAVQAPSASRIAGVDALATHVSGLTLLVRVADCGAVYFFDPTNRVIALSHSGRKGTEGNITGVTIDFLTETYGTNPKELIVQLGPCIRPPHYEVDFAVEIGRQAREKGVIHYYDCERCTACDLNRYYSYRAEKGSTGRMWAALQMRQ